MTSSDASIAFSLFETVMSLSSACACSLTNASELEYAKVSLDMLPGVKSENILLFIDG